jgi:hypothetical protein
MMAMPRKVALWTFIIAGMIAIALFYLWLQYRKHEVFFRVTGKGCDGGRVEVEETIWGEGSSPSLKEEHDIAAHDGPRDRVTWQGPVRRTRAGTRHMVMVRGNCSELTCQGSVDGNKKRDGKGSGQTSCEVEVGE